MELLTSIDGRLYPTFGGPWSACNCCTRRSSWFLRTGMNFECLGARFGGAVLRTPLIISLASPSRSVYPGGLLKASGAGCTSDFLGAPPVTPRGLKHRLSSSEFLSSGFGPSTHSNCSGASPFRTSRPERGASYRTSLGSAVSLATWLILPVAYACLKD